VRLPPRPTVRLQLAFLLAALVVTTGVVLLAASYALVSANLNSSPQDIPVPSHTPPPGQRILNGLPPTRTPSPYVLQVQGQIVHNTLSALFVQYGAIMAGLVVIAAVVAWLIAGRALRPLRSIAETAQRITGEHLHERLALTGPHDELRELGDTFDSMLARLEVAFQGQQLFAANAAHELRTPLAVIRAELDLVLTGPEPSIQELREVAARLLRTVVACERLLERLLVLTRGMVARDEREPVPLDEITRRRLAAAGAAIREQGLTVRHELREAVVEGDPWLLGELVGNLLDNAIKYNRPPGWITVSTRRDEDGVVLEIANSGQKLSGEELAGLLEPFRRASQQRIGSSTGLGLSIVRAIVDAHGGKLALEAVADGGLLVRATLPSRPEDGADDGAGR